MTTTSDTHSITTAAPSGTSPTLPDEASLGVVHLTVSDLGRSLHFYRGALGLTEIDRDGDTARVGTDGTTIVALHEDPSATQPGRTAGLYHVAINYPNRMELGRVTRRLAATRTPIQGASDHGAHEAIYLPDPDGNGLELAADRPRSQWPDVSRIENMGPRPLDLDGLLALTANEPVMETAPAGMRVGHIHLHLGDLDDGLAFYRDLIGFEEKIIIPGQAAFVSAGGYHHHVAFNLWKGRGVPPQPTGEIGLRHWTIVLPEAADVDAVRARLRATDRPTRDVMGGFATEDPGAMTIHVVTPEGNR